MSSDYERYHDAHDGWHRTSACVGTLAMDGVPKQWHVIRNTGGGTSDCCSVYPHAPTASSTSEHVPVMGAPGVPP